MTHSVIDLSKLPAPICIEPLDYEAILAELLIKFKELCAEYINIQESDPAYKILEVVAYQELLIRQRINNEGKALLLAFAQGSDLDHIGVTYYAEKRLVIQEANDQSFPPIPRLMETDDNYRKRLLLKEDSYSTAGASNAYKFHALSADGSIKDVSVMSPQPGTTIVTILSRLNNGLVNDSVLAKVRAYLNSDHIRPLSEEVIVQGAQIIHWELIAELYTYTGPDQAIVLQAAKDSFAMYLLEQQLLGADITDSALSRALHVPGVFKVVRKSPLQDIICNENQATHCDNIDIRLAGVMI